VLYSNTSQFLAIHKGLALTSQIDFIADGHVTSSLGFLAGATFAGLKTFGEQKLDLGILVSQYPCTSGGIFTTNVIKASSLKLTEEYLRTGDIRAIVVNSGIANAGVGEQGLKDAREMSTLAANHLDLESREVAICSTGLIGVELPMALIRTGLSKIKLTTDAGIALARAIITTDTFHKAAAVTFEQDGKTVTIGGIAKGSGMIHPNMATMLAFLTTDATVERSFLQKALKKAGDLSFNMISIDGDTSTNDTVLLLANGASGAELISEASPHAPIFLEALTILSKHLAKEIVRDGEGATKIFSVTVEGALTTEEARLAARTVANSNLVKTAVHGNDPNWGRIIAAAGRSGAHMQENKIALYINDVCIMEDGRPIPFFKDAVIAIMSNKEISFRISLSLGSGEATAWGCDLSEQYVTFNSAYTT
jgi:glutamate N-acetyltransferase/amino-acid N-acetyltransferase